MKTNTNKTQMKWLTLLDGEIEREHKTKEDAVFWAQGTHCTEARPIREGCGYKLGRTTIVSKKPIANIGQIKSKQVLSLSQSKPLPRKKADCLANTQQCLGRLFQHGCIWCLTCMS